MRVTSSLADIRFQVGEITRDGDHLVVHSAPGSTLATQIRISPRDARATLKQVLTHSAVWGFLPSLLFGGSRKSNGSKRDDAWQARRSGTRVNKPW
ncbi:MAG: hypothetical protein QNJ73_02765 [Gammaproteobacteria bacterium]|nr:hypothetical protein [Gammaproteobacteria bacterium]